MAEYGRHAGRDILESLELRTRELERRLSAIEGRRLLTLDRGTTTTVPAPVEGQVMVKETDEKVWWYSNQQWRTFEGAGGDLPWARRRQFDASNQTIANSTQQLVALNEFVTSDATVFEAYDGLIGGVDADAVKVLQDGFYVITVRVYWSQWPSQFEVGLNGVDQDGWAPYTAYSSSTYSNSGAMAFSVGTRLAAVNEPLLYLAVYHSHGASRDLYGPGGNHFEVVRVGDATTTYLDGGP